MFNRLHFATGVFVGIVFYDAFVNKQLRMQLARARLATAHLSELVVESEKRVVYLANLLAENDVELDEFDLIILNDLA